MIQTQIFKPSECQSEILRFIREEEDNLVIISVAGSGKTTMLEKGISFLPLTKRVIYAAFNRHTTTEAARRIPNTTKITTLHKFGLSIITDEYGKVEINKYKQHNIIDELLDTLAGKITRVQRYDLFKALPKLASMYKATLLDVNNTNTSFLVDKYDIDIGSTEIETLTILVDKALTISQLTTNVVNFDDMIYFPVIKSLRPRRPYDYFFVDEAQDLTLAQIELILKGVKPGGRIIASGDPRQAIYGFRGIHEDALGVLVNRLNAKMLPLSVTFRCPRSHVELAKQYVSEIEAAPGAIDGTVRYINENELYNNVIQNDMIICRYNAPLVPIALKLLTRGVKVIIKGKDIGEWLATLVGRFKILSPRSNNIYDFMKWMNDWRDIELDKLKWKKSLRKLERIHDTFDVMIALCESVNSVEALEKRINALFSDRTGAVTLSSIHGVKGLESNRIIFLRPELIPSEYATRNWEYVQENNCYYIALTRSRNELIFVKGSDVM